MRGRPDEVQLALRYLQPNQRADLETWLKRLESARTAILDRLGIPQPDSWPPRRPLSSTPLTGGDIDVVVPVSREDVRAFNRGRRVFRVPYRRSGLGAAAGVALGAVAAIIAVQLGQPNGLALSAIGAAAFVGVIVGRRSRYWICSDVDCAQPLTPDDPTCSSCGGTVAGEIRHADDRLAAEEALDDAAA